MVVFMKLMPWIWRKLEAVAHTLPYDAAVMTEFKIPRARFGSVMTPTVVLNGSRTDTRLKTAARALASAVPGALHGELAGQSHNVRPQVLTDAVLKFLPASLADARRH
jgi:hypothetical protein